MTTTQMINRRSSKGYRVDESETLLASLIRQHAAENLIAALVYNDFATERQARQFGGAL